MTDDTRVVRDGDVPRARRGLDLFFDAYLDRLPGLPPVGLSTSRRRQGRLSSSSATRTSTISTAPSPSPRHRRDRGLLARVGPVPARRRRARGALLVVTGGETVHCGPTTQVKVLPALHSCLFAHSEADTSVPCLGDLDVERAGTGHEGRRAVRRDGVDVSSPAGRALDRNERDVLTPRRRPAGVPARRRRAARCS